MTGKKSRHIAPGASTKTVPNQPQTGTKTVPTVAPAPTKAATPPPVPATQTAPIEASAGATTSTESLSPHPINAIASKGAAYYNSNTFSHGRRVGFNEGQKYGLKLGRNAGIAEGHDQGFADGIKHIVALAENKMADAQNLKDRQALADSGQLPSYWMRTLIAAYPEPLPIGQSHGRGEKTDQTATAAVPAELTVTIEGGGNELQD